MADNYVEIKIKASDTAKPDLTELRADLDELGRKVETARVDVDDEEAKLKLLELNAKLAALNRKVASPRITVSSAARAESDIAKINAEMDKLDQKAQRNSGKSGLLGKLLFGAAGDAEGAAGGAEGGLSSLTDVVGKIGPAMLAIVPAIEAGLVEVTGLVSGFAAAGAGAGAFAALALPAFKKVTTAYTKIGTDQKAYDDALTKTAKNTALKKLQQDYKDLDPAQRGAVRGLQDLMSTYHRMAKAFEPQAFKIFNDGLKIANELMPHLAPFANTFANALDGLLQKTAKFTGSKGFKDWLAQFQKLEGPAVNAIGSGIGKVAISIGKLLTTMSAKDDVHAINIAFGALTGTIRSVAYVVHRLMIAWDTYSSAFRRVRHSLSSDTAAMREDFAHLGHALESDADAMRASFVRFGHSIESVFNAVKHALASDVDAMRSDLIRFGHAVESAVNRAVSFFRGLPGRIRSAVGNLGGLLVSAGRNVIQGLMNGLRSMLGPLASAAANIGHTLLHAAESAMGIGSPSKIAHWHGQMYAQGLINGLDSMRNPVSAAAARLVGNVSKGAGAGRVRGAGAAGAVGTVRVELDFVGADEALAKALRQIVRVKGGNVQAVLGH